MTSEDRLPETPRPRRIVVVDDDEGIRRFFGRVLEDEGYEVATASDGRAAMELLRQGTYDLVITDLVMPEREGIETIREIRKGGPWPRIIAISGAFGGDFLRIAQMLGADMVMRKPVNPDHLLEAVKAQLSGI